MSDTKNDPKDQDQDHIWEYFASIAQQRMQVFYFYVVIAGLFWGGFATHFTESNTQHTHEHTHNITHEHRTSDAHTEHTHFNKHTPPLNHQHILDLFFIGFFFFVSLIFHLLEKRSQTLVKHGEHYMQSRGYRDGAIFATEDLDRETGKKKCCFAKGASYGDCFWFLYHLNYLACFLTTVYLIDSHHTKNGENLAIFHWLTNLDWWYAIIILIGMPIVVMLIQLLMVAYRCFIK